jgi:hypothetical protein
MCFCSSRIRTQLVCLALAVVVLPRAGAAQIPTPAAHFGFEMGADGRLAAIEAVERYFELIAAASDRVALVELGSTTEGHRTIAAIVSAPENIATLDRIREVNQQLADPRTIAEDGAAGLIAAHKVVVAIGCSIHASEVGATQAASELLYDLATAADPDTTAILQNVVLVLIPSLNPDGYRKVAAWYEAHKGTPFDGGPMPGLDHPYAGHDINRDAFMLNLAESRNLARFFYTEWHPQVFLSMHQMASDGPRFFAPPNADPIYPNYDPVLWREAGLLGSAMTLALAEDGRTGVVSNAIYDYYWPGYEDSAPLGHNTVCLLTEAASVRVASPIEVPAGQLSADFKGLRDLAPHVNFPDPWPGGRWTLRDIVEYDLTAARGLLRAAARYRADLIENFYEMGRRAAAQGERGGPFAFIVPQEQYDSSAARRLEELLILGGVEIYRTLEPFRADGDPYPAGTDVILMAQPYRAYVKTLLERQDYPMSRTGNGSPERPYDVTGWTLPAQMGVAVRQIERWFEVPTMSRLNEATIPPARVWGESRPAFYVVDARGSAGAIAANRLLASGKPVSWLTTPYSVGGYTYGPGALVVDSSDEVREIVNGVARSYGLRADGVRGRRPDAAPLEPTRVALYKPWTDGIDEGWTRWLLERHEFPFTSVGPSEVRAGRLEDRFDVLILPSMSGAAMREGFDEGVVPPEYAGGLGPAGIDAIKAFVQAGGTLVCLDQAGSVAIDAFDLPVRDVAGAAGPTEFYGPGSIVRVDLDPSDPLAFGMPPQTAGFFSSSAAYEIAEGAGAASIRVAARYGDGDPRVSGFLEGGSLIAGRPAVLEATAGAGRVILLGFRVQHRAQSLATFRLLFNAILTSH